MSLVMQIFRSFFGWVESNIVFVDPVRLLASMAVFAFLFGNHGCQNGTGEMGKGWNHFKQKFRSGKDILKGEL